MFKDVLLVHTNFINLILDCILNFSVIRVTPHDCNAEIRNRNLRLYGSTGPSWAIAVSVLLPFFKFLLIYAVFSHKIQGTKFRWYIWRNWYPYFNHILIICLNFDLNKSSDLKSNELREMMCIEESVCFPSFLRKKQVLTRVSQEKANQEEIGSKANVTVVSSQL